MEKETDQKRPYGVLNADCLEAMKKLPDNSIDSVVTDPPYGISFMGKDWDHGVPGVEFWKEALRIAKPGAHLLSFGGTRTYHRLACAIEDAGWQIIDSIGWVYSSGFPKSMDISKAIDKKLGAKRPVIGTATNGTATGSAMMNHGRADTSGHVEGKVYSVTAPASDEAKKWEGWGTCLKPAFEPIVLARKPVEGTFADNVMKYGVGGINIDGCRVPTTDNLNGGAYSKVGGRSSLSSDERDDKGAGMFAPGKTVGSDFVQPSGRFPANLIHDGSDEVLEVFPDNVKGGSWNTTKGARHFNNNGKATEFENHGSDKSVGSAARFFYCAKASKKEKGTDNIHPTVKPIALMEYLVKLVTPEGGIVLDPFMGSGSTGVAALNLGRRFIGMEKETEYFKIAEKRLSDAVHLGSDVV